MAQQQQQQQRTGAGAGAGLGAGGLGGGLAGLSALGGGLGGATRAVPTGGAAGGKRHPIYLILRLSPLFYHRSRRSR
jgi:hypothetical protein